MEECGKTNQFVYQSIEERFLYYLKYYCYGSLKSIEEATNYLHCSRRQLQRILKKLCDEGKMIKEGKGKYKIKGRNFSPLIIKHLTFC